MFKSLFNFAFDTGTRRRPDGWVGAAIKAFAADDGLALPLHTLPLARATSDSADTVVQLVRAQRRSVHTLTLGTRTLEDGHEEEVCQCAG